MAAAVQANRAPHGRRTWRRGRRCVQGCVRNRWCGEAAGAEAKPGQPVPGQGRGGDRGQDYAGDALRVALHAGPGGAARQGGTVGSTCQGPNRTELIEAAIAGEWRWVNSPRRELRKMTSSASAVPSGIRTSVSNRTCRVSPSVARSSRKKLRVAAPHPESYHGRDGQGRGQPDADSRPQPVGNHPQIGPRNAAGPGGDHRQRSRPGISRDVADAGGGLADRDVVGERGRCGGDFRARVPGGIRGRRMPAVTFPAAPDGRFRRVTPFRVARLDECLALQLVRPQGRFDGGQLRIASRQGVDLPEEPARSAR